MPTLADPGPGGTTAAAGRKPARPWTATVVAASGPGQRAQHLFAPCLHVSGQGQLMIVCRWDAHGSQEGDATNEQALFFSRDGGATWRLAGEGPMLTCALGTSFDRRSAITHAWVLEDRSERTWLYYTVNQPFTWGEGRPDRSTGGGEIRRQQIRWTGDDWVRAGGSEIVWAFQQPLPDGGGGWCRDIRAVSWNGVARLADGALVMPIGGRRSVADPRGAHASLDRVWVLVSRDDGATWPEAYFVGGGEHLCVAEPTLVATTVPDELVCLLRVQYGTGNQLHRSVSRDGGRTWTAPAPTGLPQAGTQGVKPFLLRRRNGAFALLQTNEHEVIERTNLAVFLTDEAGLRSDRWPRLRTLHVGNLRGWWPGACYGWLAEEANGDLLAAWPSHDTGGGRLLFARLPAAALATPVVVEPNGVHDELGDHVPRADGAGGFHFHDVRGRLVAPDFGLLDSARPRVISFGLEVLAPPQRQAFRVLRLTTRNGREEAGALLLDRAGWRWRSAAGESDLDFPRPGAGGWRLVCRLDAGGVALEVGHPYGHATWGAPIDAPTGLQIGGAPMPEPCDLSFRDVSVTGSLSTP